jgi:hypothetical protein
MPELPSAGPPSPAGIEAGLHYVAQLLRRGEPFPPEAQQALADLVDELARALHPMALPSAEAAHLSDSMVHLVQALRQGHDTGLLAAARDRVERAIVSAETHAPVVAGIARRLIETLSNIGI